MARYLGKYGIVKVGSSPSVVGEVSEWNIELTGDVTDATTMNSAQANNGFRSYEGTLKEWKGSLSALWDPADTNGQVAIKSALSGEIDLELYPSGEASGDTFYQGKAIITGVTEGGNRDNLVEFSVNFQGTGELTTATVA